MSGVGMAIPCQGNGMLGIGDLSPELRFWVITAFIQLRKIPASEEGIDPCLSWLSLETASHKTVWVLEWLALYYIIHLHAKRKDGGRCFVQCLGCLHLILENLNSGPHSASKPVSASVMRSFRSFVASGLSLGRWWESKNFPRFTP